MPAYLIVRATVTDMERYQQYMRLTPGILEKYGGEFVIRGGDKTVLEGPATDERIVQVKFASVEAARRMYESPEYQAAMQLRAAAADASFIVMQGVE